MTPPDEKVIADLNAVAWDIVAPKLLRFITWLMSVKGISQLPDGKTAQDLVCDIVRELYIGQRKWDMNKHPDLLVHMQWIAKSKLSGKGLLGKKIEPTEYIGSDVELDMLPQETATTHCETSEDLEFTKALYSQITDDKDLQDMVTAIEMGYSTPRDISRETGIMPDRIYELRRKLHGRALKAQQILKNKTDKEIIS